MLLTPSDIKTWKYNNLTNLTGMIWHIDPETETLETNQSWKLASSNHENDQSEDLQMHQMTVTDHTN